MTISLPPRIKKTKARRDNRLRCPTFLRFVREHACSVTGCVGRPIQAAHVRTGTDGGMGLKPSDCWAISLCDAHHHLQHQHGEEYFEALFKIDMKALAQAFWNEFRRKNPAAVKRAEDKMGRAA